MRWLVFAALIIGIDVKATLMVVEGRSAKHYLPGKGWRQRYWMQDGSFHSIDLNWQTGKIISHTMQSPPTRWGLLRVWWPVAAGVLLTLLAVAMARTRAGKWVIVEMSLPLPLMTTRRWLFAVALLGLEGGLVLSTIKDSGRDPMREPWVLILVMLALLHAVAFMPVGIVLLYRLGRSTRPGRGRDIALDRP